jgi:uncharacterized membrane protein YeiH
MVTGDFALPTPLDLTATAVFALSGAAAAVRRGYDYIGVAALALVTALGGALIRDGLFIQAGPSPVVLDPRYLMAVGVGALAVIPFYRLICRLSTPLLTIDALGLAAYTVVGAQKAMAAEIAIPGVILVGVVNGVGGSILRDVLTRQEVLLFKPGQYYAGASLAGAATFCLLYSLEVPGPVAPLLAIAVCFGLRMAAVRFNWQTSPLHPAVPSTEP